MYWLNVQVREGVNYTKKFVPEYSRSHVNTYVMLTCGGPMQSRFWIV